MKRNLVGSLPHESSCFASLEVVPRKHCVCWFFPAIFPENRDLLQGVLGDSFSATNVLLFLLVSELHSGCLDTNLILFMVRNGRFRACFMMSSLVKMAKMSPNVPFPTFD